MDDETPRLRTLLEELHAELSRETPADVDDARGAQLLDLKADIERLLARKEAGNVDGNAAAPVETADRQQLHSRLQQMVASFEGAHPRLASALEQTANALSNMGL